MFNTIGYMHIDTIKLSSRPIVIISRLTQTLYGRDYVTFLHSYRYMYLQSDPFIFIFIIIIEQIKGVNVNNIDNI